MLDLIDALSRKSPAFREWWPRHDLTESPHDAKELNHPLVGTLSLHPSPLQLGHSPDSWMLVYTPLPQTETRARLEHLLFLTCEREESSESRE